MFTEYISCIYSNSNKKNNLHWMLEDFIRKIKIQHFLVFLLTKDK